MEADEPHPDVQAVLERRRRLPLPSLRTIGARPLRWLSKLSRRLQNRNPPAVGATEDRSIPGPGGEIPVRIYRPRADGPVPAVVFYHGGGFVLGGLDTHDVLCRHLTRESGCAVLSVDYRLAPEHPFPAAVEDAYAAVEWAATNPGALGSDGRLAVAGDSAGGTLAAVAALMARDRGGPALDYQALFYPAIGVREDQQSVRDHAGIILGEDDLRWFDEQYYGSAVHRRNPYADPIEACDLSGVAPATVITAGFDPLRDGGTAYAERLVDAGVTVRYRNYDDMVHGFMTMLSGRENVARAHEAVADAAGDLREGFGER